MLKYFFLIISLIFIYSCTTETIYSGKILNQGNLDKINFKNKEILISNMGQPSFIDPIDSKFFYYSEKKKKKSIFNEKIEYSYIFVFEFDKKNNIIDSQVYNLINKEDIEIINEVTENEVIKMGLIEKVFGGVGAQQEIPTTP